jgi:predicted peptidase
MMNTARLLACVCALAPTCFATAQTASDTTPSHETQTSPPIAEGETKVTTSEGAPERVYRYRLIEPSAQAIAKAGGALPLVVFLHGSGERGSDNSAQLKHFAGWTATAEFQSRAPSFVLAVQCPSDESWATIDLKAMRERGELPKMAKDPTPAMRAVMQAIDAVLASKPVDRERVYLTGLSMGGFGAFDLAARRPELFAAVVPICGGGDPTTAPRLVGVPFFIAHGADDAIVPVSLSRKMAEALGAAIDAAWRAERTGIVGSDPPKPMPKRPPNPAYREYEGVGHDSWTPAYRFGEDGVLDWMFAQRRAPAQRETAPAQRETAPAQRKS